MNELLELLRSIKPGVDYEHCDTLIDDGLLDSFHIVSLVARISDTFDVTVPAGEIVPENFNSAAALWAMIERLDEES